MNVIYGSCNRFHQNMVFKEGEKLICSFYKLVSKHLSYFFNHLLKTISKNQFLKSYNGSKQTLETTFQQHATGNYGEKVLKNEQREQCNQFWRAVIYINHANKNK
jgi:hypothetical protein